MRVKPSRNIGLTKYIFPSESVGLYLHVPFCKHFCAFCPYHKLKYDPVLAREYVGLVIKEYRLHELKQFNSLYIGGGTPSGDPELLKRLLNFLRDDVSGEIALEVHPLDASTEKLREIKALGVNYVSLGIQSFSDEVLEHFGRDHSARDSFLALKNSIDAGFDFVDVDLVFDPLSFTSESIQNDLESAMRLLPQQISVYPMMRFSYTKFKNTRNDSKNELKIFDGLDEIADRNGYERDTLWTYRRKDLNKRYTSVAREFYLGLGLSASTFTGNVFATNTFSLDHYRKSLAEKSLPIGSQFSLNVFQGALYYSFWAFYAGRLDFSRLSGFFPGAAKKLRFLLEWLRIMGYLTRRDNLYLLTRRGRRNFHRTEEWLTYAFIDPLWRKLRSEGSQL
ncbi:hypothetical protein IX53_07330 [Kosmotoga pacifica]|uniref:Radical SAM core domain-containing protein n=1 Tax=Kosmotoga pacifica TaxID=1330330 RepID=A0A0G2ZE42_9BACT|nr:hypothetical protein IX53_07330 [Kosmotoga pacifica]